MRTIAGNERYHVTLDISVAPGYELDLDEWERALGIIIENGETTPRAEWLRAVEDREA